VERIDIDFEGARVVVTGGASGIGFGLATAFAHRGASALVLADIEAAALDAAAARLDQQVDTSVLGVTTCARPAAISSGASTSCA
jgi:NAD(P)-dependent dehydrogenase (short-subunit alcohol dehydrogenase family)